MFSANNILNLAGITASASVVLFAYIFKESAIKNFDLFYHLNIISISIIVFSLPDYLSSKIGVKKKWLGNSSFLTLTILILLTVIGHLPESVLKLIRIFIFLLSVLLLVLEIFSWFKSKKKVELLLAVGFVGLIFLTYYGLGYESPLFFSNLLAGTAHIDVIFHCAISNMFNSVGYSTTGMDGSPYFSYHWGSHVIMNGLGNLAGVNTVIFYNLGYFGIFSMLFFKGCLFLTKQILTQTNLNIVLFLAYFIFLYSFPVIEYAAPLLSQSFNLAIIVSMLYASFLLDYFQNTKSLNKRVLIFSAVIIFLIFLLKISVGLVMSVVIFYLVFRCSSYFTKQQILISTVFGLIVLFLSYILVFPSDRLLKEGNIITRYYNLWISSKSIYTYWAGFLLVALTIIHNNPNFNVSKLKIMIASQKYILHEILLVLTIVGFMFGILVSQNGADVYYFAAINIFFSILLFYPYLLKILAKLKLNTRAFKYFLVLVSIFSIISRTDLLSPTKGFLAIFETKRDTENLDTNQHVLGALMNDLLEMDNIINKKDYCIYINHEEKWFYESQSRYPLLTPMIVPAISGIALIQGIPQEVKNSGYFYYSYYYYKDANPRKIKNIEDLKKSAVEHDYKHLVIYSKHNNKLRKEVYNL